MDLSEIGQAASILALGKFYKISFKYRCSCLFSLTSNSGAWTYAANIPANTGNAIPFEAIIYVPNISPRTIVARLITINDWFEIDDYSIKEIISEIPSYHSK